MANPLGSSSVQVVQGLSQLEAKLKQIPERLAKNTLRRAVAAGLRVIRDDERVSGPRKTGKMLRGLRISTTLDPGRNSVRGKLRFTTGYQGKDISPASKALWNIFGTKPHYIGKGGAKENRKNAKALKLGNAANYVAGVHHPGERANNFVERAAERSWPKAVQVLKDALAQGVEDAVSKGY